MVTVGSLLLEAVMLGSFGANASARNGNPVQQVAPLVSQNHIVAPPEITIAVIM